MTPDQKAAEFIQNISQLGDKEAGATVAGMVLAVSAIMGMAAPNEKELIETMTEMYAIMASRALSAHRRHSDDPINQFHML